ncbi:MAG: small multi-drug export protein [Candidatus Thermoplasmatota archaeon]|nr:hypothetical protein [Euryarchaeota archaeon]MBU4032004.1 small multi-drug export protein [Candidatus Thermoplasmatota archaeon]MBU4071613.1 small multi-drug export protein [Candidatus Thermoplasmatota archaeon]MBU4144370.1 small multi-drug export protein [Candidatus Thermoplasmatota archaeon]MBU4592768.1 small multi-drug export protein [Candidatus Thermoplasmatota archaeon]
MDKKYLWKRLGQFFAPIIASVIFLLVFSAILPNELNTIFGLLLISYFISPFGREVLIPITVIALLELHGTVHMASDIALIVTCIVFVDAMCSIFLLWNLDLLKHIPKVGKWIDGMEKFGRKKLKKSRRRRMSIFVALAAYVALPFQGSNGIASTIIGMLSGMKNMRVWLAVWVGSIAGSLSVAIIAFTVGQQFFIEMFDNAAWKAISVMLVIGIFLFLIGNYWSYRKRKAAAMA